MGNKRTFEESNSLDVTTPVERDLNTFITREEWAEMELDEKISLINKMNSHQKYYCPGYDYTFAICPKDDCFFYDELLQLIDRTLNKELFVMADFQRTNVPRFFTTVLVTFDDILKHFERHIRFYLRNDTEENVEEFGVNQERKELVEILEKYNMDIPAIIAGITERWKEHDKPRVW